MKAFRTVFKTLPVPFQRLLNSLYLFLGSRLSGGVTLKDIRFDKTSSKVAVLGNGPSMTFDKEKVLAEREDTDFICVNNFCDDELYAVLRPNHYVLLDTYYFCPNAHPDFLERRQRTFQLIEDLTRWEMTVYVANSADLDYLRGTLTNPNIRIVKLACAELRSRRLTWPIRLLFNSGCFGPPQINVLLYAVYIAIWSQYSEIFIYGADLSFHKDVDVDQVNNELTIAHRHFNEGDKKEVLKKNPYKRENWTMPEFLELSADTFYAHQLLNRYAQYKGISVINKSHHSLIDGYARPTGAGTAN